ncbi:MAG: bifunctional phosphoribosyl-AMP cyclohydrolase/phosphoribosyl-ATP diphosphatase HisIE [Lachnospiraceae bacterium]
MKTYKKLIVSFACQNGMTLDGGNLLELAQFYSNNGADELFVYDRSETEADHEQTIAMIKEIVRQTDIPVITGGNIKRLEDVKKYLYAGAKAVYFEGGDEEQIDLIKEAADRFGSEKVCAYLDQEAQYDRILELEQLGASVMILAAGRTDSLPPEAVYYDICGSDLASIQQCLQQNHTAGVIFPGDEKDRSDCMAKKQQLKALGIAVDTFESSVSWDQFRPGSDGLIPVIVQDYKTAEVLMLAYMNQESFQATLQSGRMTYFSRSRQSLWLKGETSGHYQYVKSLALDCDNDTLLAQVHQIGAACHTGARSCFYQKLVQKEYKETNPLKVFEDVFHVILDRQAHPKEGSYTNYLFEKGIDKILKKLGEEATEIVIAAKNPDAEEIKYEISDFLYHMMVLMAEKKISWEDITGELANR